MGSNKGVTVYHDPSGEFRAGANFPLTEFNITLLFGYFPIGMIVTKNGSFYRVVKKPYRKHAYWYVKIKTPNPSRSQSLLKISNQEVEKILGETKFPI